LVARDAGLGEIGRMGLLMTPHLGPRVRIGVVTTSLPLETNQYIPDLSVLDFCTRCKKCAENCPAGAISFSDAVKDDTMCRWTIKHEACFTYWCVIGTDCGKCIQVCPYSHPDNLLHSFIRKGIKNSGLFSSIAIKMDDIFYGRRPNHKNYRSPVL
jgi:epoxyqueuosine reductase QueG